MLYTAFKRKAVLKNLINSLFISLFSLDNVYASQHYDIPDVRVKSLGMGNDRTWHEYPDVRIVTNTVITGSNSAAASVGGVTMESVKVAFVANDLEEIEDNPDAERPEPELNTD